MRQFVISLAFVAGLAAAPFALAEAAPEAPKPAKPAQDDPNRVVCTREHEVGSNRPKKVCLTVAQRDELREQARRNMDDSRHSQDRGVAPTNTGS